MKLRVAELNIEILNRGKYIEGLSSKYIKDFLEPDITVSASDEDITEELGRATTTVSKAYAEATAVYRKLGYVLPQYDGYILHAATFELKGRGIAFLAKSGTGKSTHLINWMKLFGDELQIINGDKPIVRFKNGEPYAYGTPWCGKEGFSQDKSTRLTDICFIVRDSENKTVKLEGADVIKRLLNQIIVPSGSENIIKILDLIDQTVKNCNIWEIHCNTDISSAEVSSKTIFEVK